MCLVASPPLGAMFSRPSAPRSGLLRSPVRSAVRARLSRLSPFRLRSTLHGPVSARRTHGHAMCMQPRMGTVTRHHCHPPPLRASVEAAMAAAVAAARTAAAAEAAEAAAAEAEAARIADSSARIRFRMSERLRTENAYRRMHDAPQPHRELYK